MDIKCCGEKLILGERMENNGLKSIKCMTNLRLNFFFEMERSDIN